MSEVVVESPLSLEAGTTNLLAVGHPLQVVVREGNTQAEEESLKTSSPCLGQRSQLADRTGAVGGRGGGER